MSGKQCSGVSPAGAVPQRDMPENPLACNVPQSHSAFRVLR